MDLIRVKKEKNLTVTDVILSRLPFFCNFIVTLTEITNLFLFRN